MLAIFSAPPVLFRAQSVGQGEALPMLSLFDVSISMLSYTVLLHYCRLVESEEGLICCVLNTR